MKPTGIVTVLVVLGLCIQPSHTQKTEPNTEGGSMEPRVIKPTDPGGSKYKRESRSDRYRRLYRETYDPENYRKNYRETYRDNPIFTESVDRTFRRRIRLDDVEVDGRRLPEGTIEYVPRHERPVEAPPTYDRQPADPAPVPERSMPGVQVPSTLGFLQQRSRQYPLMWMQTRRWQSLQDERGQAAPVAAQDTVVPATGEPLPLPSVVESATRTRFEEAMQNFSDRRYIFSLHQLKEQQQLFPDEPLIQYANVVALFASGLLDDAASEFTRIQPMLQRSNIELPTWLSMYGTPRDAEVHLNRLQRHADRNPSDAAVNQLLVHFLSTSTQPNRPE